VVISVAALTGVPLYLPVIWSLFSKRVNKVHVLFTTLFSLFVNLMVKFAGPVIGIALSREYEMLLGALLPIAILACLELNAFLKKYTDPSYVVYIAGQELRHDHPVPDKETAEGDDSNRYGKRVIGISIASAGTLVVVLGIIATSGRWLVTSMGILLLALGLTFYFRNKPQIKIQ
jgi:solute:Na+ symporter, SSS family